MPTPPDIADEILERAERPRRWAWVRVVLELAGIIALGGACWFAFRLALLAVGG